MHYKQQGSSIIEYSIGLAILVSALLAPIPPENKSVVAMLEDAIKAEHSGYLFGSSLPRLP